MSHKVLFTASTFSHIRNFHLPYLKYFQENGWEVHVACGGEACEIPFADLTLSVPFQKSMTSPQNIRAVQMLRKQIQGEKYDLISTHTSLAAFFTRLAVKNMKDRPLVVNIVHGYLFDDSTPALKKNILVLAEKLTAEETDLLLTMNQWDLKFAQKHHLGERVDYIPGMGVDYTRFEIQDPDAGVKLRQKLGISEDATVLIYPAEFSARKNQGMLLDVMKELPDSVVLVLPGYGALLEECQKKAHELGIQDRVFFPGQIQDMLPWFQMADIAVSASRSEGLPFNIMEAMYCGLPVVASNVKGHTDLIDDGINGKLFPFNDITQCKVCLEGIIAHKEIIEVYSSRVEIAARKYSLQSVYPNVSDQYGRLAKTIGVEMRINSYPAEWSALI